MESNELWISSVTSPEMVCVRIFFLEYFYVESFSFFKAMALRGPRHRRQLRGKAVIFQNVLSSLFLSAGKCNIMPGVWASPIFPKRKDEGKKTIKVEEQSLKS